MRNISVDPPALADKVLTPLSQVRVLYGEDCVLFRL
jgi:hypothetical protein